MKGRAVTKNKEASRTPRTPMLSPQGLFLRAIAIVGVFILLHLFGLRENMSILSGTSPTGEPGDHGSTFLGALYMMFYFGAVLVSPILVFASGFLCLMVANTRRVKQEEVDPSGSECPPGSVSPP